MAKKNIEATDKITHDKRKPFNVKDIDYKEYAAKLSRHHLLLILSVVAFFYLMAFLQIKEILNPTPNQALIDEGLVENKKQRIHLDQDLIEEIKNRNKRGTDVTPQHLGNANPFD